MSWGFIAFGAVFLLIGTFRLWAEIMGLRSGTVPAHPLEKWNTGIPWIAELGKRDRDAAPRHFWLVTIVELLIRAAFVAIGGGLIWLGLP